MKPIFILLVFFTVLKGYGQDLYSNYQTKTQQLSVNKEKEENGSFDRWAIKNILGPGQVYLACDGWPGIGYVCRLHHKQCCDKGCDDKYNAEMKNIDNSYQQKIIALYNEYNKAVADANKKAEEDQKKEDDRAAQEAKNQTIAAKKQQAVDKAVLQNSPTTNGTTLNSGKTIPDNSNTTINNKTEKQTQPKISVKEPTKTLQQIQEEQRQVSADILAGTITSSIDIISKGVASNKSNNFFNESSMHFGLSGGFTSPNIPIVINQSSTSNTGAASNRSYVSTPAQLGLKFGLNYDPIISDYITFGVSGSFIYAINASFLGGPGSSVDTGLGTTTGTESMSTINFNYGSQFALGAKKLKLLIGYFINSYNSTYKNSISSNFSSGSTTVIDNIDEYGSAIFNTARYELGLRLGTYKKTCFDIIYGQENYKDFNNFSIKNNVYKLSIWKPSVFKLYIEYSNKYAAYGINQYNFDDKNEDKRRSFINIGLLYNKDWF